MSRMNLTEAIIQKSIELGFDLVGVTCADQIPPADARYLCDWLNNGHFAGMEYMNRNVEKRIDPAKLFENAASIVCVGLIYKPERVGKQHKAGLAKVSDYAVYEDYHGFMKQRLLKLAEFIEEISENKKPRFKACVDTVPVAERSLAARAGLGFIGKNHMLINPDLGVEIFLGELMADLELEFTSKQILNGCGDCEKCLNACPTGALGKDGSFDANKCISYQTIENKEKIPEEIACKIGDSLYGCDRCVAVCPYHINAPTRRNLQFKHYRQNKWIDPAEILQWDKETFEERFAGTAVERLGIERLKRNAKVCIENIKKARPE